MAGRPVQCKNGVSPQCTPTPGDPTMEKKDLNFDQQFQETLKHLGEAQNVLEDVISKFKKNNFIPQKQGFKISIDVLKGLSSLNYYLHALFASYGFGNWQTSSS